MLNKGQRGVLFVVGLLLLLISEQCIANQFKNIGVKQGLSHSHVISFLQDAQGFMWIGTFDGLNLYSGYSLMHYTYDINDTNSITNNCIYTIIEDSYGYIWIGTEYGLNRFDKKTGIFTNYLHNETDSNSLFYNHVRVLLEDQQKNIWIGTYGGGFGKFNTKTQKFYSFKIPAKQGLSSEKINTIFEDSKGLLWLGTEKGGLLIFDPKTETFINHFYTQTKTKSINDNTINSIYEDIRGNFWIGTWNGGLNKYNPNTSEWTHFQNNTINHQKINLKTVRDVKYDQGNWLWLALYGDGLCRFNMLTYETQIVSKYTDSKLDNSQKYIWSLYTDKNENLWMGTFGYGLFIRNHLQETFAYSTIKDPTDNNNIQGIASVKEDHRGIIWFGTIAGKLYTLDRKTNTVSPFGNPNTKYQNIINAIYEDRANRLWIATNNGLYRISADRRNIAYYEPSSGPDKLNVNSVIAIFEDSFGDLWLSMWGAGINILTADEMNKKNPAEAIFKKYLYDANDTTSVSHHLVWSFMEDSHNDIWMGTNDVLNKFDRSTNSFIHYKKIKTITTILEDDAGYLWALSMSNGLYQIDKKANIISKTTHNNFANKIGAENLLQDNSGNFWMSSRKNLYKYNPRNNNFSLYTSEYGLQDDNFLINAYTKLKSGELVFAGMKGYNIFTPENIPTEKELLNVIITNFKIFGKTSVNTIKPEGIASIKKPIYTTDSITLTHKQNTFSVEFAALDFFNPKNVRFYYKLEGLNNDWIETNSQNRTVTYSNLKGGNYIFKVRSSDMIGNWNSKTKELYIFIKPPIWQTLWFKILLSLFVITIGISLYKIRIKQLSRKYIRNQEGIVIENLQKDYEIAYMQVDQLKEELAKKNKKNASLALKQIVNNEEIESIIDSIKEIKGKTKSTTLHHELNSLLQNIDNKFKSSSSDDEFIENINLLYDNFSERFAKKHLKLTHKDLKICAYLRMNKSNKEIAKKLNITSSSLEISRYRIRKKLNLGSGHNLNDYILRF